jgi:hypothetical protein
MPLAPLKPSYGTTTRPLGCTTDTTVEAQENVSGSTSVACAAVGRLFCRERVGADLVTPDGAACAGTATANAAVTVAANSGCESMT